MGLQGKSGAALSAMSFHKGLPDLVKEANRHTCGWQPTVVFRRSARALEDD
jgi:hypothetical protein